MTAESNHAAASSPLSAGRFRLNYAPHFGMFQHSAGGDLLDELRFAADEGFRAWEDNAMRTRPVELQNRIARTMQQLDMQMGVISALGRLGQTEIHFAGDDRELHQRVLEEIKQAVETARRVNARWLTVIPGLEDPRLPWDYQTANCVELLRRACDIVEPHGLTMVIEPLNRSVDHPGRFLHRGSQGCLIVRAVDRPGCKVLYDIYHQQIAEGNLWRNLERGWNEIAYLQVGDNPGRAEPGTGEINYRNLLGWAADKGWAGIVGMEHKNSRPGVEGERAVLAAYRNLERPAAT